MPMLKRMAAVPALLALSLAAVALPGCDEGPAERTGEKIDEGTKDMKRAVDDATD